MAFKGKSAVFIMLQEKIICLPGIDFLVSYTTRTYNLKAEKEYVTSVDTDITAFSSIISFMHRPLATLQQIVCI